MKGVLSALWIKRAKAVVVLLPSIEAQLLGERHALCEKCL
jgi:hypothetical protein